MGDGVPAPPRRTEVLRHSRRPLLEPVSAETAHAARGAELRRGLKRRLLERLEVTSDPAARQDINRALGWLRDVDE